MNPSKKHIVKSFITFILLLLLLAGGIYALNILKSNKLDLFQKFNIIPTESSQSDSIAESTESTDSVFNKILDPNEDNCVGLDLDPEHLEKGKFLGLSKDYRVLTVSTEKYPELYLYNIGIIKIYKVNESCKEITLLDLDPAVSYDIAYIKSSEEPLVKDIEVDGTTISQVNVLWLKDFILYVY